MTTSNLRQLGVIGLFVYMGMLQACASTARTECA